MTALSSTTAAIAMTSLSKPATTSFLVTTTSTNAFPLKTLITRKSHKFPAARFSVTAAKKNSNPKPSRETQSPNQTLKSRLRGGGEPLYGIFLLSFSPTMTEIAGLAGYDFAVVDMEHGPGGVNDALHCIRALSAAGTPAVLRVPESSATWAKKALDLGPQGIMFPMIDSPKDAKKAVSYTRFPPAGVRGSAHTVVRASKYGIDEGYLSNYEDDILVMCQVESEQGAKRAAEIAGVEGVDCVQIGPLDLSASMGFLWDPAHKKVREAQQAAETAVLEGNSAYLSGFAMPHDSPEALVKRGYHMVSGAVDVGLFRRAAVDDVARFRGLTSELKSDEDGGENADDEDKYWSE